MAKWTMSFGALLAAVGLIGFVGTGSVHPTALIPLLFGLVLVVCGVLANTENPRKRMLWMHIAVTIGLLGFLFPGFMAVKDLVKSHVDQVSLAHPAAVHEQLAMAVICLAFVVMCVRSFISARRARTA